MEKERTYTRQDTPFQTSNAVLAFCLWRAGVKFIDPAAPCYVVYDVEMIRRFTNANGEPIFKGWELEKAVVEAHRRGLRGHVTYSFKMDDRTVALLSAYSEQEKVLAREDISVEEIVRTIVGKWADREIEDDEALMRLACVDLKTRGEFMQLWQKQVPCIRVMKEGSVTTRAGLEPTKAGIRPVKVLTHPGYMIYSVNASKKTREKLGV